MVKRALVPLVLAVSLLGACTSSPDAATPAPTSAPPGKTVWLCRPGLADNPCDSSRDTTVVTATGATSAEPAKPAGNPAIDCFYVYPTVSGQAGLNADLSKDPEVLAIARVQASRFTPNCRVFAPVYRQVTLRGATGASATAGPTPTGLSGAALAYSDVRTAWQEYLANDNKGRGFVLIGHSQGTGQLIQLVKDEIDTKPEVRAHLVSALLLGGNVTVAAGKDVGGSFQNVPACRRTDQTGCVVAYSAFMNTPPATSLFGRSRTNPALQVLCTNPASLAGGSKALQSTFSTVRFPGSIGASADPPSAPTPWVSYPGLYTGQCETLDGANVLHVVPVITPGDPRKLLVEPPGSTLGLHLYDVTVAYGDLVNLVQTQAAAYKP